MSALLLSLLLPCPAHMSHPHNNHNHHQQLSLLLALALLYAGGFHGITVAATTPPSLPQQALPVNDATHAALCTDVDATVDLLVRTLDDFRVPFTTIATAPPSFDNSSRYRPPHMRDSYAGAAHNHSRRPVVQLTSIQRMMRAFGCPPQNPSELVSTGPTPEQVNSRISSPTLQGATVPATQRFRQRREADDSVVGRCYFAAVVDGTCPGPLNNNSLTIVFRGDEHVDNATDVANLRAMSARLVGLDLRGVVREAPLRFLAANGNWRLCQLVIIQGVQVTSFDMTILNPFSGLLRLAVRNSEVLRHVAVHNFASAGQLVHLDISNNSLTSFPDRSLAVLTSLETLDLTYNRLGRIDEGMFAGLSSLLVLNLQNNLITHLAATAFDVLTRLEFLALNHNDITTLPPHIFRNLGQLARLFMSDNPIRDLHASTFQALTAVQALFLNNLLLTQLSSSLFSANTQLTDLRLDNNALTSMPDAVFARLFALLTLRLSSNALTLIGPGLLRDLTALQSIDLSNNALTALPQGLLDSCPHLGIFSCNRNQLTTLPAGLFRNTSLLGLLFLTNNRLESLADALDHNRAILRDLDLEGNQLTRVTFATEAHSLQVLNLRHNPIQVLPDVSKLPSLRELRLQNHLITRLDLTPIVTRTLSIVQLDAAAHVRSTAVIDADTLLHSQAVPRHTLSLLNVDASSAFSLLGRFPEFKLQVLHAGWEGAAAVTLPKAVLCSMLAADVRELQLHRTGYELLPLCEGKRFGTVLLQDNRQLETVIAPTALAQLNVSGCTRLTAIDAPFIDVLDISETRVQASVALCTRWGRRILFARNMPEETFSTDQLSAVTATCLRTVDMLDISHNTWLDRPGRLTAAVGEVVALSNQRVSTPHSDHIEFRPTPPVFQLTDAPVECTLLIFHRALTVVMSLELTNELVYSFECACAQGHHMDGERCVRNEPNVAGVAVGSVIGGLFFGLLMAWLSRRYRGLTKRIGLQEQLLVERDEEVMALKKAWEIEYDELRMIKRVAAGAFGVVFKAEWDTVMVAVKVLQQGVMMFDESTVLEFEKEVEFLQRTRHPNVVRFFGAGTDPNGSPFLVLEFVAMGSLKDLLGKNMGEVLMGVEQGANGGTGASVIAEDEDELTLVSTESDRRAETMTVWELKLRLLRDVASGMAFIHSLDQMHRDLKSGNVLVSSSLRAKITDFGSIRQCFTRDRNQQQRTRLSSSHDDDPQYSKQAGLQTMTSMTLTAGVGTPLYMAPEALTGDKYSFEADIFSFGVLMWEVGTQRVPDLIEQEKGSGYRGPILATLFNLMKDGKRLRFEDSEQDAIPEWFQSLTYKCMAQDPRERPSFGELKDHHFA
ncbi:TKL protein kinase [Salpingoeca rosetta]|uniref:TKL protein kinase n=1 Tax=Salpingoeca rosetta (strain ATCC 50818 / BSB-021) TaxID=946362 RepID=F2UMT0_SALR5|nr:TKL protein kinase [Salpingoeca rosetta]EGD78429.1 TKL protein kinase [Salpingoeca rosetta]|eukprot:XP_004989378.1 TKL protein kinase [Salpingoeca rosetta]